MTQLNEEQKRDKQFILATELTLMLMENRHLSMEEALDTLYNSHTFRLIEDENTGLYYQGPVYVMEYLNE